MKRYILLICWVPLVAACHSKGDAATEILAGVNVDRWAGDVALILVALLFALFFLQINRKGAHYRRIEEQLRSELGNQLTQVYSKLNMLQQPSAKQVTATAPDPLNEIRERLKTIEKRLDDQGHVTEAEAPATGVRYVEEEVAPVTKQPEPEEVFYLSSPNLDGSFNVSSMQNTYKPTASIYWFKKTTPDKAIFKIDSRETSVRMALLYADKTIDPVCEPINGYNPAAKKITSPPGEEGEAVVTGDKWKVTRKARIIYE